MRKVFLIIPLLVVLIGAGRITGNPEVLDVCAVDADIICLYIRANSIEPGKQIPYIPEKGDSIFDRDIRVSILVRNGKRIGYVAGKENNLFVPFNKTLGKPLDHKWVQSTSSYLISSLDDPDFREGMNPVKVFRKTKPVEYREDVAFQATENYIFLKLGKKMTPGKRYTIHYVGDKLKQIQSALLYDAAKTRSEAVHVIHSGFRADDPVKCAHLGIWLGDGGAHPYNPDLKFSLIDTETKGIVYNGKVELRKKPEEGENEEENNFNRTYVYEMDFSKFNEPGTYVVSVEGVGCSYPFNIGEDNWRNVFYSSVRGLYHQRSGIELKLPFTEWTRPRPMHPDDEGVIIYDTGLPTRKGGFEVLRNAKTDKILPNAWGGYQDAGDWDRRPQHLDIGRWLLELYFMHPDYFDSLNLNIPESYDDIPDIVNEALWVIDFHKRIQDNDGGIRRGIESGAHPRKGEGSWQESLDILAFGSEPSISYEYTGVAMKAAFFFKTKEMLDKAKEYEQSAMRAFEYAERSFSDKSSDESTRAVRNYAAAELYRYTGDSKWHKIFKNGTIYKNYAEYRKPSFQLAEYIDAAWVYTITESEDRDQAILNNYMSALLSTARASARRHESTAYRWIVPKGSVVSTGAFTRPDVEDLVRAHYLTGEDDFLKAIIYSCLNTLGGNQNNMSYTTGIGHRSPKFPLHEDTKIMGKNPHEGITVQGPMDMPALVSEPRILRPDNFQKVLYPEFQFWPVQESYFDIYNHARMCEFTVHRLIAPSAYVWGYLAGRK